MPSTKATSLVFSSRTGADDALDALSTAIKTRKVNWIVDISPDVYTEGGWKAAAAGDCSSGGQDRSGRLRAVCSPLNPFVQILKPKLEVCLVVLPRHAIYPGSGLAPERVEPLVADPVQNGARCKGAARRGSPTIKSSANSASCVCDACTLDHRRVPRDEASRRAGCGKSARPVR